MATVAFVLTTDQPQAGAYYKAFPAEPVLPDVVLKVDDVKAFSKEIDLIALSAQMAASRATNVVLVSHGTGGGLQIPLKAGVQSPLGITETNAFNDLLDGKLKVDQVVATLKQSPGHGPSLTAADVAKVKDAIVNIRTMKIDRLVLRACKTGEFPSTLDGLRQLFRPQSVCAPDYFDVFGLFKPTVAKSTQQFETFAGQPLVVVDGSKPNRFAWTTEIAPTSMAESSQGAKDWVSKRFPLSKYDGKSPFPYHALRQSSAARPLFPLDSGYRSHLKRSPPLETK